MRPIQVLVFLSAVLSGIQAENGTTPEVKDVGSNAKEANSAGSIINSTETIKGGSELPTDGSELPTGGSTSARRTSAQPEFIMSRPDGPGIQAGFQAAGSNYATTFSGGIKSPDGATIETGLNFVSRFGDPANTRSSAQQPGSTQQQSARSTQQAGAMSGTQGSSLLDGATFAVSYKPGLLSAIGNLFNPMRMFQQFGDALAGLTGFGQVNAMSQAQSQYSSPQASRPSANNNGLGITWKPLYRVLWP